MTARYCGAFFFGLGSALVWPSVVSQRLKALMALVPKVDRIEGGNAGLAHRLDMETSGCVLVSTHGLYILATLED